MKVLPDFQPEFNLALNWSQLSNGNWYAIDRTSISDVYATTVNLYGHENDTLTAKGINEIIAAIEDNRTQGSNVNHKSEPQ
jgi:hypothetical protein